MLKKRLGWLLLALVTLFNLRLFLGRWAEEPRSSFGLLVSDPDLASLTLGFGACVVAVALLETLRSRSFVALILLPIGSAAVAACMPALGVSKNIQPIIPSFAAAGALAALCCVQLREGSVHGDGKAQNVWASFVVMTLATLNAFLLMAPWTAHVPSYVQDVLEDVPLSSFYFGSVHSDVSPVSVWLRWLINSLFSSPSINATAISSMVYASLGISMAGVALEMAFGRLWGWGLLVLAWTDRWLFAGAVSSAIVGQPILSTGGVLLLCTWTVWRKPGLLSWREVGVLSAVNSFGLLYNLYGYSAARMTWLAGSGLAALILVGRRAVRFNWDGLCKVSAALLPSAVILGLILVAVFDTDIERFKAQIIISPEPIRQIKDVNSYRVPVTPVHDPDIPIWWGTGLPTNGEGVVLYWKRTPQELYDKVKWFMHQLSLEPPIPFVLVLLGGLGMALSLASPTPQRRSFAAVLILLTLVSFSTFLLAQDHSAYRRGLATNLLLLCGVVAVFAVKCRQRYGKALALSLCGALAVLKAPTELNALFNDSFLVPVCASCRPTFDVRDLVNDPSFASLAARSLRFEMRSGNPESNYLLCAKNTIESNEFRELAPNSAVLPMKLGELRGSFSNLDSGDILVVSCFTGSSNDPEVAGICAGDTSLGRYVATIPSDPKDRGYVWWSFIEKP